QKQFINKYRAGQRSKQAHGRELLLNRFIENETIENTHEAGVMGFKLPPAPRSGDQVIVAHNISAKYDDRTLFEQVTMTIQRGQRIGVIGPNGCGKSTLIRTMLGMRETDSGKVKLGASVSVGYYHQTHEHLPDELTPVGYLKRFFKSEGEQRARDLAGAFGFSGIDQDKPLGVLSGGERTRTVLAGLMVGGHNLLVLDEPSNHLDIPSSERLEESLQQFDGTLLLITHDRMLLEDTVNELLVFEEAGKDKLPGVRHFAGTYREYVEQCKREEGKRTQAAAKREVTVAKPQAAEAVPSPRKSNAKRNTRWGHLSRKELEQRIASLEKRRAELDAILADVDLYRDPARAKSTQADRKKTQEELSPLEEEWLRRAEEEGGM
ncbi:MAG: ATP-binding cassette domain-containing protein, partial [Phycisphaeraceae bacterium]